MLVIQTSNIHTMPLVRNMWKECFGDNDEFLDLHFLHKYKHENTLVFFDDNKVAASLQMFPYEISFWGRKVPFYYLAGLCTLPQYRQKGYMAQLMHEAHKIMGERNIPLSILVPAEEWLFGFYNKFGYEQVFESDDKPIALKELLENHTTIETAYEYFDLVVQNKDFYVQKSFDDFKVIIEEAEMDAFPLKYNLSAMARIIDLDFLIGLYNQSPLKRGSKVKVKIAGGNLGYGQLQLANGEIQLEADIRFVCRLLFGFKTSQLPEPLSSLFPEHNPVINLMLE